MMEEQTIFDTIKELPLLVDNLQKRIHSLEENNLLLGERNRRLEERNQLMEDALKKMHRILSPFSEKNQALIIQKKRQLSDSDDGEEDSDGCYSGSDKKTKKRRVNDPPREIKGWIFQRKEGNGKYRYACLHCQHTALSQNISVHKCDASIVTQQQGNDLMTDNKLISDSEEGVAGGTLVFSPTKL